MLKNEANKKIKKQRPKGFVVAVGIVVAIILIGVIALVWGLKNSVTIRRFKNDVWIMTNEYKIPLAEYNGVTVRMSDENVEALGSIPERSKYRLIYKEANPVETITYTVHVNAEQWIMTVSTMDNGMLRITLDGQNHYSFYFDDRGEFETYRLLASPEGYVNENTILE